MSKKKINIHFHLFISDMMNTLAPPIILTAFGTTTAAHSTYTQLERVIRRHFPERTILWGYSSRAVARELRGNSDARINHPTDILNQLAAEGCTQAIVQSLHLLPGHEFHGLHHEVRQIHAIDCQLGMPLLCSSDDYNQMINMLAPRIIKDERQAILLVGHGTRHPVWPAYLALESLLQRRFGPRVFVGVVEHSPDTTDIERRIADAGFDKVLMVPFFLVAGLHFRRDMIGDNDHSWRSRLIKGGFTVESVEEGIGLLPGLGDLVARHIQDADKILQERLRH